MPSAEPPAGSPRSGSAFSVPPPTDHIRHHRWTAVSVLLAALCTAFAHAPDRGEAWWLIFLVGLAGAIAAFIRPTAGHWIALGVAVALVGCAPFTEAAVIAYGLPIAAPVAWLVAGFKLQERAERLT